jgi:hypothetical protein
LPVACLFVLAGAGPATAGWQRQTQIPGEGFRPNSPLLAISCPTTSLCVAGGELDRIVSSTNPTAGPSAWKVVQPEGELETDCHAHWVPPCRFLIGRTIRGISCPTTALCVAVTSEGYVFSTTNPTGSAAEWRVADVDGSERDTHILGLSCPSTTLCVAVSGDPYTKGKVLTSTDPTGGSSAWQVVQLDETLDLREVSCSSPGFCLAVAQGGRMLVSSEPTGGPSAWRELGTPGGPGNLQAASCTVTMLCVAGNAGGNLLTSTSPGDASSWAERNGGSSVQITGIDCLPTRQCVAVDNNGDVLTTSDPSSGAKPWSLTNLIPYVEPKTELDTPLNGIFGVSCVSLSFCAITAADGQIFTNVDPFADSTEQRRSGGPQRQPKRPRTIITLALTGRRVADRRHRSAIVFRFHAGGKVRGFLCARDRGRFRRCHSPVRYRAGVGKHVFKVRAIGATGLKGPITTRRFAVVVQRR